MAALEKAGAAAVKPTGSGGGGYVLSLWAGEVPASLKAQLVPIPQP
jgi:mevalonate kinase